MKSERRPFTFGSCCAGIGGIDLGLEQAGMECLWQVEVDPYCQNILTRHWPNVHRRGDMRLIDPADLEYVDLIAGGIPCQPASQAGVRRGSSDQRWLWPEFLRLVRGCRPSWVLAENPTGLIGLKPHGLDWICGELEAAGYTCLPLVVGAWAVGSPQGRHRVWLVAHTDGERREAQRGEGLPDGEEQARRDNVDRRYPWPAPRGAAQFPWEAPRRLESGLGRSAHGFPQRMGLKMYGNAAVPPLVEMIGRAILKIEREWEAGLSGAPDELHAGPAAVRVGGDYTAPKRPIG